jgi:succinyl-CoA synthetase beta subunit
MCGKILVSPESGYQGFLCRCVYVVEELDVKRELYLCVKNDRKVGKPVIIYGTWNGTHPDNLITEEEEEIMDLKSI